MRTSLSLVPAAVVVLTGCGSQEPANTRDITTEPPVRPAKLPASQQRQAFSSQQAVSAYCRHRTLSLRGPQPPPSERDARRAFAAADRLVELARARPFDLVQTGVDMRLYLSDLIEDLGNLDCDPALVSRLEEGFG